HWQIQKGGGFHYHAAELMSQSLPVTVFLGGRRTIKKKTIAPLPEDVPELILSSLLSGNKLQMTKNLTCAAHRLVSEAEFALIGHAPPHERRPEGPFGDHYGYYSLQHDYPVFHCD